MPTSPTRNRCPAGDPEATLGIIRRSTQDRQRARGAAEVGAPGTKKALAEIWNAEDRRHALDAVKAFEAANGAKLPKAVAKITDDVEELLAFYDFPAEHWQHLWTTNPIESTFATVRHRTKITRGPGSRAAGLAMAFKLIEAAPGRWRAVNGPHLVALVRARATFKGGKLVERPDDHPQPEAAQGSSFTGLDYFSMPVGDAEPDQVPLGVDDGPPAGHEPHSPFPSKIRFPDITSTRGGTD